MRDFITRSTVEADGARSRRPRRGGANPAAGSGEIEALQRADLDLSEARADASDAYDEALERALASGARDEAIVQALLGLEASAARSAQRLERVAELVRRGARASQVELAPAVSSRQDAARADALDARSEADLVAAVITAAGSDPLRRSRALAMLRQLIEVDGNGDTATRAGWYATVGIAGDVLRWAGSQIGLSDLPALSERVQWLREPVEGIDATATPSQRVARAALAIATGGGDGWPADVADDLVRLGHQIAPYDREWFDELVGIGG